MRECILIATAAHHYIKTIDPSAEPFNEGSSRWVFASKQYPIVYKVAKDLSGMLQNDNERLFAEYEHDYAPALYKTYDVGENKHAILAVERVDLLSDHLDDFMCQWLSAVQRTSIPYFQGEITYADAKVVAKQIPAVHQSVKDLVIDLFSSEDNTLPVERPFKHFFDDICERLEPLLVDYFSELIDRDVFCMEECTVDNIGLRQDPFGYAQFVVLDGGIPNVDFLNEVLNMGKQEPIIT